jgi:WD40 repeat protein
LLLLYLINPGNAIIRLWNPSTGKEEALLGKHSASINAIAFHPNGKILASGDDRGYIKIWYISSNKSIVLPKKHTAAITSLSFSPNGQLLVSGSKDKTIRVWTPNK